MKLPKGVTAYIADWKGSPNDNSSTAVVFEYTVTGGGPKTVILSPAWAGAIQSRMRMPRSYAEAEERFSPSEIEAIHTLASKTRKRLHHLQQEVRLTELRLASVERFYSVARSDRERSKVQGS